MKIKSIITFIAVILFTACDEFLEPDSLSTFDSNYIFSNVDDTRKAVNSIYSHFGQDAFRSRLSNNMTGNTDIERQSGWTSDGDRYQIWDLRALPSNRDLEIVWTFAYRSIRDANICIEGIQASLETNSFSEVDLNSMNSMLGEAYTLRAYWYSILAYFYGDVPFFTEAPKAGADFFLPKEDRNVILSSVINDLIEIEDQMLWADQLPYGIEQVNREYTLGMIARLSLQRGGYYLTPELTMTRESDYLDYYQIAKEYAQKLIDLKDRPLPTNFRQVFLNQSKFLTPENEDVLYEVAPAIGDGDVGWNIGITVRGGSGASHDYGSGNNYMSMPPTYFYSFDPADKRRDVTCSLYEVSLSFEEEFIGFTGNPLNISQGKWSRYFLDTPPGPSTAKGTGINWPMMRYADVILMLAEAENELNGPTAIAQEALKRVRQRAFDEADWPEKVDNYVSSVSGSKEDFFNAIVDERAWEFGGEMIRKYELIRWNLYKEKVQETVDGLKAMADRAYELETGASVQPDDLPHYLFWKRNENGSFTTYNVDFAVPSSEFTALEDDGWIRNSFLLSLHDDVLTYDEWITRDYANYLDPAYANGTVRYIMPIPISEIESSNGTLANDGYGF